MTKKELLAIAKEYQIVGRHDMTVVELQAAIDEYRSERDDERQAAIDKYESEHYDEAEADEGDREDDDEENQQSAAEFQAEAEKLAVSKEALKNVTRRYPSLLKRDEQNRVIRAGKNLSGNRPFNYKFYYVNPALADEANWTPAYREAFDAAPKQVKGILKCMAAHFTDKNAPEIGREIVNLAKSKGFVESKIDSDKLMAYYRRALEVLGMIHAIGYDPEGEE